MRMSLPLAGQLGIALALCLGPSLFWLILKRARKMLSASAARRTELRAQIRRTG